MLFAIFIATIGGIVYVFLETVIWVLSKINKYIKIIRKEKL